MANVVFFIAGAAVIISSGGVLFSDIHYSVTRANIPRLAAWISLHRSMKRKKSLNRGDLKILKASILCIMYCTLLE